MRHAVEESNAIKWFTEQEVRDSTSMFLSTKKLALEIFDKLNAGVEFAYEQKARD